MKKTTTLKALVLSLIMTIGFVMPMAAQTDGFFKLNEDIYENRDGETPISGGITNQQFGQTVPVGSGLLIMVAAGAGYAVVRRKRARKGMTLLLAFAMLLGMTQCKKNIETVTDSQSGVFIKVNITNNTNTRHDIITTGDPWPTGDLGKVVWENGDFLFVMSDGLPVGAVYYSEADGAFSGIIGPGNVFDLPFPVVEGEPLVFCFTGNMLPDDETGEMLLDISDQRESLPVLSVGTSNEIYPSATGDYNAFLENQCALVKFTLSTATDDDIRISNMHTVAELVLGDVPLIKPTNTTGSILLHKVEGHSDERWAILLPQDAVSGAGALIRNTAYKNALDVPKINKNDLAFVDIDFASATAVAVQPYFSVGGGKIVHFAQGNLQYKVAGPNQGYRFAEHQWDFVGGQTNDGRCGNVYEGGVQCSNNSIDDPEYSGLIDLFGWGTGNRPTTIDQDNTHYYTYDEWGNYINDGHTWFTLYKEQYEFLINNKTSHAIRENKIAPAVVHGVGGFVILPDYFDLTGYTFNLVEDQLNHMDDCSQNIYTDADWAAMENAGAVFFPAAGERSFDNVVYYGNDKKDGYEIFKAYWSRTDKGDTSPAAFALYARNAMWVNDFYRCHGLSVRLVHEVEF